MREEILAYKRERILEEAVKLFYERGFTGTTLDDIAAELGVTKPFIYTHFRSKTDLLAALCKPTIELSLEAVRRAAKCPDRPPIGCTSAIVDFTQVVLSRQANIAIYFREEKNLAARRAGRDQRAAQEVRPRAVQPADRGRRRRRIRRSRTSTSPRWPSAA